MEIIERINVPIEYVYLFDTSSLEKEDDDKKTTPLVFKDKTLPNRFWFQFPAEWRTSNDTERIIGIRCFYQDMCDRDIEFTIMIKKVEISSSGEQTINEVPITVSYTWIRNQKYREAFAGIQEAIETSIAEVIEEQQAQWEAEGLPSLTETDIVFLYKHRDLTFQARSSYTEGTNTYETYFKISEVSEDFKAMFLVNNQELTDEYQTEIVFPYVWYRYPMLLNSSLATNSYNNFIGYTGVRYNPIKYYKFNGQDSRFWIDMFAGHEHTIPVSIPADGKDNFEFEIVLLHNAKDLY